MHVIGRQVGADRSDAAAFNEDVGYGRFMDIAVMIVHLAAPDQELSSAGIRGHKCPRTKIFAAKKNAPAAECQTTGGLDA
ncbi:MAG: hypothetical protein ACJ8F3_12045 [Xanthobacteraceae bacterium]